MADKVQGSVVPVEQGFLNYVLREPVGVVGQIVPWNFPLMFTSWKLGPALAAGNTVVLKPAELTPLSSLKVAELCRDVGIPRGVVNIVPGYGATAGQHLAEHPGVDKIAFTGSTAIGRKIVEASAGNLKRVQLELGGKGANIVFDDAFLPAAVGGAAFAIFHNQGQACIAGSRLLLHETIADAFLESFLALARTDPDRQPAGSVDGDGAADVGAAPRPRARLREDREGAGRRGAARRRCARGERARRRATTWSRRWSARGRPIACARKRCSGPFVSVTTFRDEEEVVAIANGTPYGLGGGLWTRDLQRAHRMAAAMRTGMVWINCYKRVNPGSPFGGVASSGLRARDGVRGDARLHRGQVGLGQRRREDPTLLPARLTASGA